MVGAVELLDEQTRSMPAAQKTLARVHRALREMSEFTDALLMLSREDAVERATTAVCDVQAVFLRVLEDQRAIASDKHIAAHIDEHSAIRVLAPQSMVAMVLGNLVRNAVQHGQGERIDCTLSGREITVRNPGRIELDSAERVFERSFTTSPGGHGMGLYLAQRICQRYGWDIDVKQVGEEVVARVKFAARATQTTE
jgi:signal transduction histidine kinase